MLKSIEISNFLLIEDLYIDWNQSMTVLTGETGAGKSLFLDALSLILGKRGGNEFARIKDKKVVLEANFEIKNNQNIIVLLQNEDIDLSDTLIVRREILMQGRSRHFINDTPVSQSFVQSIAKYLIDIHSQDDISLINQDSFWRETLDKISLNQKLLGEYLEVYTKYFENTKKLEELELRKLSLEKEQNYESHLYEELQAIALDKEDEQEKLEGELSEIENVDFVKETTDEINFWMQEESTGLLDRLGQIKSKLEQLSTRVKSFEKSNETFQEIYINTQEWFNSFYSKGEEQTIDEEKKKNILTRLQEIYNLQVKHKVQDIASLIKIREELSTKVHEATNIDEVISQKKEEIATQKISLDEIAKEISTKRKESAKQLSEKFQQTLKDLGMPTAKIQINIEDTDYNQYGKDNVSILAKTNEGSPYGKLKTISSGGEKSRMMFSLKCILQKYNKMPTLIFDEIDTGVSGHISEKMGEYMLKIAKNMQVITITHSPQVAAVADYHYWVYKFDKNNVTCTQISKLTEEQRVKEIAKMISGKNITEEAINHAKKLINN